ncbi:hypothetical protein AX17_000532 [Amanita inopinata Kibby_2008]|nr:hypothetical protein AX17_000532 [Amanita inopinata Kibby_2008]
MSTLLRPVVLDSCQTVLRGRRRSSIHPINAVPRLFATSFTSDDVVIADEPTVVDPLEAKSSGVLNFQDLYSPSLSPPSNAHLPDLATKITIPRHCDAPTVISPSDASTLPSSSPVTPGPSRTASWAELIPEGHGPLQNSERSKWRLAAGFFAFFLCGWGDGVTATVIPYFMNDFHLTSMTLSLLFSGTTCGFVFGTLVVERVLNFLGQFDYKHPRTTLIPTSPGLSRYKGKKISREDVGHSASQARILALAIGSVLISTHFIIMGLRGGFTAMFIAYAIAAFARAVWTATLNVYFAQGPKQSISVSYGLWSFGGVASPLVCQAIIARGVPWSHFYFGSLVVSGLNFGFLLLTFWPTPNELSQERREAGAARRRSADDCLLGAPSPVIENMSDTSPDVAFVTPRREHTLRLALSTPLQWALSITSMLYYGAFVLSMFIDTVVETERAFSETSTFGRWLLSYYRPDTQTVTLQATLPLDFGEVSLLEDFSGVI